MQRGNTAFCEVSCFRCLLHYSSFRNVCPDTFWDGSSVNKFRTFLVCSRFSLTKRGTFSWFHWIRIFFQTQFWCSVLWLPRLHHPMQICWTVILDAWTNRTTLKTVWLFGMPEHNSTFSPLCHIPLFISVNELFPYSRTTY